MLKAGTLLLTACLWTPPVLGQDAQSVDISKVIIADLKEKLAKTEQALDASQVAEAKARNEAVRERKRAEATLEAAAQERAKGIDAQNKALADRQPRHVPTQDEMIQELLRRNADLEAKANGPSTNERKGRKNRKANPALAEQVEKLTKEMEQRKNDLQFLDTRVIQPLTKEVEQLKAEVNALKAQLKQGQANPGGEAWYDNSPSLKEIVRMQQEAAKARL